MRATFKRSSITTCVALCTAMLINSPAAFGQATETTDQVQSSTTVVEELAKADGFSTLASAIETAGLAEALGGEGPFTIFAPSDEAFKQLGSEKLEALMQPENRDQLVAILKAHVASGVWTAEKIAEASEIPTVDGGSLTVTSTDGNMMVGSATIDTDSCFPCSNGMIHGIDEVLPAQKD